MPAIKIEYCFAGELQSSLHVVCTLSTLYTVRRTHGGSRVSATAIQNLAFFCSCHHGRLLVCAMIGLYVVLPMQERELVFGMAGFASQCGIVRLQHTSTIPFWASEGRSLPQLVVDFQIPRWSSSRRTKFACDPEPIPLLLTSTTSARDEMLE